MTTRSGPAPIAAAVLLLGLRFGTRPCPPRRSSMASRFSLLTTDGRSRRSIARKRTARRAARIQDDRPHARRRGQTTTSPTRRRRLQPVRDHMTGSNSSGATSPARRSCASPLSTMRYLHHPGSRRSAPGRSQVSPGSVDQRRHRALPRRQLPTFTPSIGSGLYVLDGRRGPRWRRYNLTDWTISIANEWGRSRLSRRQ